MTEKESTLKITIFDILKDDIMRVVTAYDKENPLRTADCHPYECECLRCSIDMLRPYAWDIERRG